MFVIFRTDASLQIGTGHVMRCLTLADALRERGAQSTFICREHAGHLSSLIEQRGHRVLPLPAPADDYQARSELTHAAWLGTDWAKDAEQTRHLLGSRSVDWLVVDHYALDHQWERALRPCTRRLMVIDDLADRSHDCDVLLDQNLGRAAQDYVELLKPDTTTLVGPHYALLRPEFVALRAYSLARRTQARLEHLLITMGGVDKDNATGQVLDALNECELPRDVRITVVMGPHAPWLETVRAQASKMQRSTEVLVGVNNMAQLMADSDLAIGAAGSTSWERCCLGVPSLVLVLARNQQAGATALQDTGAAIALTTCRQIPDFLGDWRSLQVKFPMLKMSQAAAMVTDGSGCQKIVEHVFNDHA